MAENADSTAEGDREPTGIDSTLGTVEVPSGTERTRLGDAAATVVAVAFIAIAGPPGLVTAVAVLGCWLLLGPSYAFALGQLGVASLLSDASVLELAAVEVGLVGVVLAAAAEVNQYQRGLAASESGSGVASSFAVGPVLLALAWLLASGAIAWAADRALVRLSVAGLSLVAATGLVAYGLHRHHLVSLGKVGDARE